MEVKMQTSFIPKKPVIEERPDGQGVSLFLLLSIILFIAAIALAAGVFIWQKSLAAKIEQAKTDLIAVKDTYEEDTINPLIRLDDRINEASKLLSAHIAVSPVFTLLETNVLKNVRLKSMKFSFTGTDKIRLELSGTALNYEILSKQSDAFGAENLRKFISEPVISDFNPTADGSISFNFTASIYPKLISYESTLPDNANQ